MHFLYRLTSSGFDLSTVNRLFLSHPHLDHTSDANAVMDWLIRAKAEVEIFAPPSLFAEQRISNYHSGTDMNGVSRRPIVIDEKLKVKDKEDGSVLSFFPLVHDAECFGFTLWDRKQTIAYISDTSYAKTVRVGKDVVSVNELVEQTEAKVVSAHTHIADAVRDCDVLIVNIDSFLHGPKSAIHLSVMDLLDIVAGASISRIILTHINPAGEVRPGVWGDKLAAFVQTETGVPTICPGRHPIAVEL